MTTVKGQLKETLVGTIKEPELSQDAKVAFDRNARKDEDTGELYMTEEEFVNAIAPANEDYVSWISTLEFGGNTVEQILVMRNVPLLTLVNHIAQDSA